MGGLIDATVVRPLAWGCRRRDVGTRRFGDLVDLLRQIDGHLALVLTNVECHAQERLPISVDIGRVEVDIILRMRIPASVGGYGEIVGIPICVELLPGRAPFRGSGSNAAARNWPCTADVGVDF